MRRADLTIRASVAVKLAQRAAVSVKDLHPLILAIGQVEQPVRAKGSIVGLVEYTSLRTGRPQRYFLAQVPTVLRHALCHAQRSRTEQQCGEQEKERALRATGGWGGLIEVIGLRRLGDHSGTGSKKKPKTLLESQVRI